MPKVTIEFNLPTEEYEHMCAIKGSEYRYLLTELLRVAREKFKYDNDKSTKNWEEIYLWLWAMYAESKFDPYDETT